MLGRVVPWASWQEWSAVREQLHSTQVDHLRQGIHQVDIWRARGRVPLGVDSTATLLNIRLHDPAYVQHTNTLPSTLLRAQYSIVLVRLVNGVADQAQRGRVATSVANLAAAAGLPRMLVDVRHEATHNELPQLPALRVAADAALAWLTTSYWDAQAQTLDDAGAALRAAVQQLVTVAAAAAGAGRQQGQQKQQRQQHEDSEEEDEGPAPRDAWRAAVKAVKAAAPPFAAHAVADALLLVSSDSKTHMHDAATQLAKHWTLLPSCVASSMVRQSIHAPSNVWWWEWLVARRDVPDDVLCAALQRLLHAAAEDLSGAQSHTLRAAQSLAAAVVGVRQAAPGGMLAALCSMTDMLTSAKQVSSAVDTSEAAIEALENGLEEAKEALQALQARDGAHCEQQRRREGRVEQWHACAIGMLPDTVLL